MAQDKENCLYDHAMKKLFPREKNLVKNQLNINGILDVKTLDLNFSHTSYKRSYIESSKFSNMSVSYCSWTGSNFLKVAFLNSIFLNSNFQQCVFTNSFFHTPCIKNCTFDFTIFKNIEFENITFIGCNFSDAKFVNCVFKNCKLKSSNLDGTKFIDCSFINHVVRNLNMDYSHYCNCDFKNSELSMFQTPYTIGLLDELKSTGDLNNMALHGKNISYNDFQDNYINYLLQYFKAEDEYFPLANLYGFLQNKKETINYINIGIRKAIMLEKFRLSIHFCELACYYNCLSSLSKRKIIEFIDAELKNKQKSENINEFIKYAKQIEDLLLTNYTNRPALHISLKTNLKENDTDMLEFIKFLDYEINSIQGIDGEHRISFSHNSPWWLDIIIAFGVGLITSYTKDVIDYLIAKIKNWIKNRNCPIDKIVTKEINTNEKEKIKEINIKKKD